MIIVTIQRKHTRETPAKKTLLKTRTPTQIKKVKTEYSGGTTEEIAYEDHYEVVDTVERENITTTLLTQEIEDETRFNLESVIGAINGLFVIDNRKAEAMMKAAIESAARGEE